MTPEQRDNELFLAKIRKTISDSEAMLSQMDLRIAETDRFLAGIGMTREEVLKMQFSPEQRKAVNEELVRNGLPPLEEELSTVAEEAERNAAPATYTADDSGDLEARKRKLSAFMRHQRI